MNGRSRFRRFDILGAVRARRLTALLFFAGTALVGCKPQSSRAAPSVAATAPEAPVFPAVASVAPPASEAPAVCVEPPPSALSAFVDTLDVADFQKGNIHTHSSKSDGHSPPRDIYLWYRDHGYSFLALTDHNQRTDPERYRDIERKGFVILPGEEITMSVKGIPVHVNALCSGRTLGSVPDHALEAFATVADALHWAVQQTLGDKAVALVNHPNFVWAFTADALPAARGAQLLEMWSGHPAVHSEGEDDRPSEETIWDAALTRGESFAGVAVDDTHYLDAALTAKWAARPGRGWVEVFGAETSQSAICDGLAKGRLYASSGVKLRRIRVEHDALSVWPVQAAHVDFIGANGVILASAEAKAGVETSYHLKGGEVYVRARVTSPSGKHAWTQAYRTAR